MKISRFFYKPERWTKNCLARTKEGAAIHNLDIIHYHNGKILDPSKYCVSYSLYGALMHLYTEDSLQEVTLKLGDMARRYSKSRMTLAQFNNHPDTSFKDIMNVLAMANL